MNELIFDKKIMDILYRYANEIREEKIRSKWNQIDYSYEDLQERITIFKAIG